VNRPFLPIPLQDKHAWAFGIVRLILHQDGFFCERHNVTNENTIIGELFVTVLRHFDSAGPNEIEDPLEGIAHGLMLEAVGSRGKETMEADVARGSPR